MMSKARGLILKVNKLSDNDALFTVLCEDMTKITVIAKGIRSMKHKSFAAMQQFCYNDFELNGSSGFFSLSSAALLNNFYNIRSSVDKLSFGAYLAEAAKVASEYLEGDNEYFRFLLNCLYFIENAEKKAVNGDVLTELKRIKGIFELKTVSDAGFAPSLDMCAHCGAKTGLEYFDVSAGGAVCKNCSGDGSVRIYPKLSGFMKFILAKDMKTVFNTSNIDKALIEDLNYITEKYFQFRLEYYFKSLDYLNKVIENM